MPTSFPGAIDALSNPTSGSALTSPSHASQHADANDAIEAIERRVGASGVAFPGAPAVGDRFLRTDRNIEYFWDGTRWLSVALHAYPLPISDALLPIAATNGTLQRGAWPYAGVFSVFIERAVCAFHVAGGGSALSGSHSWIGTLIDSDTSTIFATFTINSGVSGVWRVTSPGAGSVVGAASVATQVGWTKTGTPGNLYALVTLHYRLIG